MSKNAAGEALLGTLHQKVATVMVGILDSTEKAITVYNEAVDTLSPEEAAMLTKPEVSPTMLSAMTKFLSDNSITCNPEESKVTTELEKRLAAKRSRNGVSNVVPLRDVDTA